METDFSNFSLPEKQLISTLNWFRSHYALYQGLDQERPATLQAIEQFGKDWIGGFKLDWSKAFQSLLEKGIIIESEKAYRFSEKGALVKEAIETELPFFQMEYDNFFNQSESSESHKSFCEKVYGINLSQHGLIDQQELGSLINSLQKVKHGNVLDLGCGNGSITAYLQKQIPDCHFTGIDISGRGIAYANDQYASDNLAFYQQNMNSPKLERKFDAIISLDTFYYVKDVKKVIENCRQLARPGAKVFAYFSQWIMDESYKQNLQPDMTGLARACKEIGLSYKTINLTESGLRHWKLKEKVLMQMKTEFSEEGYENLWDYRFREATRYANWGDDRYARYYYEIAL